MPGYLNATLFCEGKEDAYFLQRVLTRQLDRLAGEAAFRSGEVLAQQRRTVRDASLLDAAVIAESKWFDIIFIHHDWNERGKVAALRDRVTSRLSTGARLVGVVPVRETEAWILADPGLLAGAASADVCPPRPRDVESIADPKIPLQRALGCRFSPMAAEEFGENISLDRLAEVPAYQSFLQDLTTALKELNFQ